MHELGAGTVAQRAKRPSATLASFLDTSLNSPGLACVPPLLPTNGLSLVLQADHDLYHKATSKYVRKQTSTTVNLDHSAG